MTVLATHHSSSFAPRSSFLRVHHLFALILFAFAAVSVHAQERTAVHKVPPTFPPIARQMGVTGSVVVTTTVDATGKVVKAESNSGNKLLAPAAIEAVKQWKFAPGDGTTTLTVTINFERS